MKNKKFDISYLSVDSIQEGVGSSQITPLILGLAKKGKQVCLITFEKVKPSKDLVEMFSRAGVEWVAKEFGKPGPSPERAPTEAAARRHHAGPERSPTATDSTTSTLPFRARERR